jgi:HEPN family protein
MSNFDPKSTITLIRMTNQFLGLVDSYRGNKTVTLHEVIEKFSEPYRNLGFDPDNHAFFNQEQMLTSLWAYIVLPKEDFYEDIPECTIQDLDRKWGLSDTKCKLNLKDLVRKLRNSISHARISVSESLVFTFTDNGNFKFVIDENGLRHFVQALAYWVMTKDENLRGL